MAEQIDHFLFVPGLIADVTHPAGNLINQSVQAATHGTVTTEIVTTYDEMDQFHIPLTIAQQAENITECIKGKDGRVAVFAHSLGCIPTALALAENDFTQVDHADVILAGTPINPDYVLGRLCTALSYKADPNMIPIFRDLMPEFTREIYSITPNKSANARQTSRYDVATKDFLGSFPSFQDHVDRLQKLNKSTFLLSGRERVTDCTIENINQLFPNRIISPLYSSQLGNTVLIEGADHNLRGYCEKEVPRVIFQRLPDLPIKDLLVTR